MPDDKPLRAGIPAETRLAPLTLMAGFATGLLTVAVHQRWWALALALVTATLMLVAAPPGAWTRLPFGLGYAAAVGMGAIPRPEGDYLISSDPQGIVVLVFATLVATVSVVTSLATLRRPARSPHAE